MFKEKILEISESLPASRSWWPKYFYHFTDIKNVVSILNKGVLLGRARAQGGCLMCNDNASPSVINITNSGVEQYARLYFRPLTPTQYHNEGYKPPGARNSDVNASCPVPVFLLFSANKMLQSSDVYFTKKSMAGHSTEPLLQGLSEYSNLPFGEIFSSGSYNPEAHPMRKSYRMAEVLVKDGLEIDEYLTSIICRSEPEKETLLYLLKKEDYKLYSKFIKIVRSNPEYMMFENNGIYIKEIIWEANKCKFIFNENLLRMNYAKSDINLIKMDIELNWMGKNDEVIKREHRYANVDYSIHNIVNMQLDEIHSDLVEMIVYFDKNLMYENIHSFVAEDLF